MRAFVYTRQSLDRSGAGAAVDRQREDCHKLCQERGWTVVQEFTDNDVSASSKKPRPAYIRMLEAVERREAEVVVAWHVDRLTRKLTDLENLIELAERTSLRIATVTGDVDLSTDAGRLVGRILASVARGEVERKGTRQKRAQQQAAQQGRWSGGRRPFGYGAPTGETHAVRGKILPTYDMNKINELEAKHVREGYAALLQGASLKSIARRWNDAGAITTMGTPWTHTTVRRTLQNRRYAGVRTYRGEIIGPAAWPALVDEETLEAAIALLAAPERRTTSSLARKWLLPSLALCGVCGSDMATGHNPKARGGARLYVCRANKCVSRVAEPVDALISGGEIEGVRVRGVVVERLSRPDAIDLLSNGHDPDVELHKRKRDEIEGRLADLAVALEEGILTLAAVRQSSERLRAELVAVEKAIASSTHADVLRPLVTARDVDKAWADYDLKQRRAVIDALMTITLLPTKRGRQPFDPETVRVTWRRDYDGLDS